MKKQDRAFHQVILLIGENSSKKLDYNVQSVHCTTKT